MDGLMCKGIRAGDEQSRLVVRGCTICFCLVREVCVRGLQRLRLHRETAAFLIYGN